MPFLFHDYETFGSNPVTDFPVQFAAIRTDDDFNPIGQPINWFCRLPSDYLPHPEAVLVTGITPQTSLRKGLPETEFAGKVYDLMMQPDQCQLGYNSIKFDDVVTRHLFHRNFLPPYEREYHNNNSRWDLIDLARATFALRPDGIMWPQKDNGSASFKLEDIATANGLVHKHAHDALSDVEATIGLAKLIKQTQPKIFEHYFRLRKKANVIELISKSAFKPLVWVHGKVAAARGCMDIICPIVGHPTQTNAIICVSLLSEPDSLFSEKPETLITRLYQPQSAEEDSSRPPISILKVNQAPFIAPLSTLTEETISRFSLDLDTVRRRWNQIMQQRDALMLTLEKMYSAPSNALPGRVIQTQDAFAADPDTNLYHSDFTSQQRLINYQELRAAEPWQLAGFTSRVGTRVDEERLFRYRARNFFATLNEQERHQWQQYCQQALTASNALGRLTVEQYIERIEELMREHHANPKKLFLLQQLQAYIS